MRTEHDIALGSLLEMSMHLQELCKDPALRGISESSLSLAQIRAVNIVGHFEPEGITVKELSRILKLFSGAASKLVDRIVREGMISRIPSSDDRRSVRLTLTAEARRLAEYHSRRAGELLNRLLKDFPAEDRKTYLALNREFDSRLWNCLRERAGHE